MSKIPEIRVVFTDEEHEEHDRLADLRRQIRKCHWYCQRLHAFVRDRLSRSRIARCSHDRIQKTREFLNKEFGEDMVDRLVDHALLNEFRKRSANSYRGLCDFCKMGTHTHLVSRDVSGPLSW